MGREGSEVVGGGNGNKNNFSSSPGTWDPFNLSFKQQPISVS